MSLTNQLKNWYPLSSSVDDSISGNNGTNTGVTFVADGAITVADFDGTADRFTTPNQVNDPFSVENTTVSLWLKTTTTVATSVVIGSSYTSGGVTNPVYALFLFGTGLANALIRSNGGTLVSTIATTAINDGAWHHVCYTRSTTQIEIFIDGVSEATGGFVGGGTLNNNNVGGFGCQVSVPISSVGSFYDGLMSDAATWNRVLSGAEISQIQAAGEGGFAALIADVPTNLRNIFGTVVHDVPEGTTPIELRKTFGTVVHDVPEGTTPIELRKTFGTVVHDVPEGTTPVELRKTFGTVVHDIPPSVAYIEGDVWELSTETAGETRNEGVVWELSAETAGGTRNEGVVWELSAEPLDKPSLSIPDITGTAGTSSCFYATASYTTTGSILYSWEWTSIPSGSLITSGSRTGFSGSGGAYSEVPTGSIACYLPDITGSYVVKGTFYNDTGSGGGSFAFDTATGVVSDPPAPPGPILTSSNPSIMLVEADDASSGYVFNTNKIDLLSVQRARTIEQIPFIFGTKSKQTLRLRTNQEFTGSS